jgi:hypothetical protein
MQLRVLVLDDTIRAARELLFRALAPLLEVESKNDFTGRLERAEPVPLRGLPVNGDFQVSFEFNQSDDAGRVFQELTGGRFRKHSFDLVLLDDHWGQGDEFAGQDSLLGAVLQHVPVHDEFLPAVVLWTKHWGEPANSRAEARL